MYRDAVEWESRVGRGRQPVSSTGCPVGYRGPQKICPSPGPLPWAQHERAFNELSETFSFFTKMQKSTNLLEINYDLRWLVYVGEWVNR